MARVLLLCLFSAKRDTRGVKSAFVQYLECIPPLNAVDKAFRCAYLRWATRDGRENKSEICRSVRASDSTQAREQAGAICIQSTVHVLWWNAAVHLPTTELA